MKISLHGVGMIHISRAHNQRQNTTDLKYQQKLRPQMSCQHGNVTSDHQIVMRLDPTAKERKEIPWRKM